MQADATSREQIVQADTLEQRPLLQKRIPIHPRSVRGKFRTFKWGVLILAYSVFFALPWLPWGRHGAPAQAVLFDLASRRFFLFGLVVYPQDVYWLALLLFLAAVLLFFATALVGRAFCGYFCFQTLWTDAFIAIERLVQGERPARLRLHKQPLNPEKAFKLALTHGLWLLLAFWTALGFILYFGYAPGLAREFFSGQAPQAAYFTVLILTVSTYLAAGWAREQVCIHICPYSRFQSAMYDPETLAVAYDAARGEGSAGRLAAKPGMRTREERQAGGHGDCIDCGLCVQVCPAGIDIRAGMQYQCISCGLCIDACNGIMDSMGFSRGLIRYDSEENLRSARPGRPRLHWKRLKIVGYGAALVVVAGFLVYSVAHRSAFEESIQQVRQPLFVQLSDGRIRNRYQIRVTNKATREETYLISVRGIPQASLDLGSIHRLTVPPGKTLMVQASVKLTPAQAEKVEEFEFVITPESRPKAARAREARFFSRHGSL